MNEKELTGRKEIDLEISDFLWDTVRNWRIIVICALAGAVLFGSYQYIQDTKNANITPEETVQQYTQSIEEMESALGAQDLDMVYGAVAIKKQLDEKSIYSKNSLLMAINPYEESVITLQYCIKSENENAAEIASIYQDYILNGDISSELIDLGEEKTNASSNIAGAYESGFTVRMRGANEEQCRELENQVKEGLEKYTDTVSINLTAHELVLLNETANVIVDQSLAQLQDDTALAIKNLGEHLDTIKSKMDSKQLELYVEYTENQVQENENNNSSQSVEDKTTEESGTEEQSVASTQEDPKVHLNLSKIVMGGGVGVVLAVIWSLLHYLLLGRLRSEEEIKTLYHVHVLGTVRHNSNRKSNAIDQWILRARYHQAGSLTEDQELELISSNIKVACRHIDNKNIYLTGSAISSIPGDFIEKLVCACEEKEIHLIPGKEICYDAQAFEKMAEVGQAVIIEKIRGSRYTDMYQEVIRCKEQQIEILGTIVLDA